MKNRKLRTWALSVSAGALLAAAPALSQESDWSYAATVYLFAAETTVGATTPFGPVESTLSFSDALENLDFAFMGAFEASNGRLSFIGDYMLNDLSFSKATPGPAFSGLTADLKTQIFGGYAAYRVHDDPTVQVDLTGGFRWFDTEATLTLLPGVLAGGVSRMQDDWVDPVVGVRARLKLADRWFGTAFLDYGGFSSSSHSWQALLTADYAISDNWLLRFGYRHLSIDHDINGLDFSFEQSGPVFGATYQF